ncbi:hypothetical protein ACHWQZ_G001507 [Mnemiopsis leidyi]
MYSWRIGHLAYDNNLIETVESLLDGVSEICPNDEFFYQACGLTSKSYLAIDSSSSHSTLAEQYPCGYICQRTPKVETTLVTTNIHVPDILFSATGQLNIKRCDGVNDCLNTDLDEQFCEDDQKSTDCDLTCQGSDCYDENVCNGLTYGVVCEADCNWAEGDHCLGYEYFIPAYVCDGVENCSDGQDEKDCTIDETTSTCFNLHSQVTSRLHNFTRCGPLTRSLGELSIGGYRLIPFCDDFMDQTNCTDSARVGMECLVNGYNTTIAKQIICPDKQRMEIGFHNVPTICDNGLDKACFQISPLCMVHKHLLCNNVTDCSDHGDETQEQCMVMTKTKCLRNYRSSSRAEVPLPLAWAKDGVMDCLDGSDESEDWPTCGTERTFRAVLPSDEEGSVCDEVFLCHDRDRKVVSFLNLCDRRESCGNELDVCSVSRMQHRTFSLALQDTQGSQNHSTKFMLLHCLKGFPDFSYFRNDMDCSSANFYFPLRTGIFGWNKTVELSLPVKKQDCRHLYGEYYVFLSCLGLCENVVCPITRPIKWNSCPGTLERRKIFTVDKEGQLTFLIKEKQGSDLFVCENTKCVSYGKVCNLENDCGDFSDESMCINHFQCNESGEYLPIVQKCDGTIHCSDKSDECNEMCGRQVVSSTSLKVVGWMVGFAAIFFNSVSLGNGILSIKASDSESAFLNKSLVILVGVGDFLIGVYLVFISTSDTYYSNNFCNLQLDWLSSDTCVALGIISTIGSQFSLFSMTSLSLLRVSGIMKGLFPPEERTRKSLVKSVALAGTIMLASSAISFIPLIEVFEDFFVNGLKYADSNSLFIGCPGKAIHIEILQIYYGRLMTDSLTWSQIKVLVDNMFSSDYGGISRSQLSFYGNDPTCLFKYFVRRDDPQKNFVLTVLSLNFTCFIVITCSYLTIVIKTNRSATKLQEMTSSKPAADSPVKKRIARLQRVTKWIILTDFVCWVPFIVVCIVHFLDVIDATEWYPIFSLLVLPINSVINPLLYDMSLRQSLYSIYSSFQCKIKTFCLTLFRKIDRGVSYGTSNINFAEEIGLTVRPLPTGSTNEVTCTNETGSEFEKEQGRPEKGMVIKEQAMEKIQDKVEDKMQGNNSSEGAEAISTN